jgi:hypothetical protein
MCIKIYYYFVVQLYFNMHLYLNLSVSEYPKTWIILVFSLFHISSVLDRFFGCYKHYFPNVTCNPSSILNIVNITGNIYHKIMQLSPNMSMSQNMSMNQNVSMNQNMSQYEGVDFTSCTGMNMGPVAHNIKSH